jgi:Na+(H+)/acetate symporter ActP
MGHFRSTGYSRYHVRHRSRTFFAVIGISLGISDPVIAQYIGFILHVITGMAAGNVFGQISVFWSKITPYSSKVGIVKGLIVGVALWIVLFVPFATFGIQPRLDTFASSAPNQFIYNIAGHFNGLYPIIIGGSLVFHLIYGYVDWLCLWKNGRVRDIHKS